MFWRLRAHILASIIKFESPLTTNQDAIKMIFRTGTNPVSATEPCEWSRALEHRVTKRRAGSSLTSHPCSVLPRDVSRAAASKAVRTRAALSPTATIVLGRSRRDFLPPWRRAQDRARDLLAGPVGAGRASPSSRAVVETGGHGDTSPRAESWPVPSASRTTLTTPTLPSPSQSATSNFQTCWGKHQRSHAPRE